jgi:hypothetical protein
MSDTIFAMRRVAVLVLASCAPDASLRVTVQHDPDYKALVDHTEVSIYVSPDITCDAIEFGDVTDDQLLGARVAFAVEGAPLEGIPRVDQKLIVARGYSTENLLVTAGCATFGEVSGDQTVTVSTVAAATVAVNLANDKMAGLVVTTTDARNDSIDGRKVMWRVYAPAGTSPAATVKTISDGVWEPTHPTCTSDGDATIHPALPTLPSGYALKLRVSWATKPAALLSAFTPIDSSVTLLGTVGSAAGITRACALQAHGGNGAIVCMISPTQVTTYSYDVPTNTLSSINTTTLPTVVGDAWTGVISIPGNGTDRDVYAISVRGAWKALNGAPAENVGTWCTGAALPCGATPAVSALQVVPACGSAPGFLLAQMDSLTLGAKLRIEPFRGGTGGEYLVKDGAIINAGCVAELQADTSSKSRQVVVLGGIAQGTNSGKFTAAVFDCSATMTPCIVPLPTNNQAAAFLPGAEERLIGTTFDATGAQLAEWVVQPVLKNGVVGRKDRLVERSRQVAAAPPHVLVTGSFDNDHKPDLLWAFLTRTDLDVQIAYARTAENAPLTALTVLDNPNGAAQPIDMFAFDFNGDGYDEVVIVAQVAVLASNALFVARTGIPYTMQITPTDDQSCP